MKGQKGLKGPQALRRQQGQDSDSEGWGDDGDDVSDNGLQDSALNMFGRNGGSRRVASNRGAAPPSPKVGQKMGPQAVTKGNAPAAVTHAEVVADAGSARYRGLMAAKAKATDGAGDEAGRASGGRRGRQSDLRIQLARARLQRRQQIDTHQPGGEDKE